MRGGPEMHEDARHLTISPPTVAASSHIVILGSCPPADNADGLVANLPVDPSSSRTVPPPPVHTGREK